MHAYRTEEMKNERKKCSFPTGVHLLCRIKEHSSLVRIHCAQYRHISRALTVSWPYRDSNSDPSVVQPVAMFKELAG
jgi:hypothetical protein